MPDEGDIKFVRVGGRDPLGGLGPSFGGEKIDYTWHEAETLGEGYPSGWYARAAGDRDADYGGNGNEPVQGTPLPEEGAPAEPGAGLVTFRDADGNLWQETPGDPEKLDPKTKEMIPAGPSQYKLIEKAGAGPAEASSDQPIISEDGRFFKSSPTDQWQRIPSQAAEKPPTVAEMKAAALNDYFTKGDEKALNIALELDDFENRPSQLQKLEAAIRYAQSPADYLTIVGMMRGEIPIGPSGSTWRLGPQNQVFDAFGFPASPVVAQKAAAVIASGGQAGAGGAPVSTGGAGPGGAPVGTGEAAGGMEAGPGPNVPMTPERQAQIDALKRQQGAPVAAPAGQGPSPFGLQAPEPEGGPLLPDQPVMGQTPQLPPNVYRGADGRLFERTNEGVRLYDPNLATPRPGEGTQPTGSASGGRTTADEYDQPTVMPQTGMPVRPEMPAPPEQPSFLPSPARGPEGELMTPPRPGEYGSPTRPVYSDPGQEAARRALEPSFLGPSGSTSLSGGQSVYRPFAETEADKWQRESLARIRAQEEAQRQQQGMASTASTPATSGPTTGVSFLDQAYGRDILAGRPKTSPSMAYPELARRQGVTVPQFRSAQTRMNTNPMEEQLFQSGLQLQGVDVPTYLQQEQFTTTPGGSKRRRVSFLR